MRVITVRFYATTSGQEPVKQWLINDINADDRKIIGQDLQTVEFGWPMGMPLVRKMEHNLWEVRSHISKGIARVFFCVKENNLVLLHGFIKKSQSTPKKTLKLAQKRRDEVLL